MWISKLCKYANPQDCGLSQAGRYVEQHGATQALSCEARQVHRSVKTHGPVASCASTVCGSMQVHEKGASQIFACSGTTQNCIECGDTQTHTLPTLGTFSATASTLYILQAFNASQLICPHVHNANMSRLLMRGSTARHSSQDMES